MPERFILDANVLYSARLRDLFLQLHRNGTAYVYWTQRIENEWTAALAANRPELRDTLERTVTAIRAAFPSAYIPEELVDPVAFGLPDPADEHVAQAALAAGTAIITLNLAHFPSAALDMHRLTSISPDEALKRLANEDPDRVLQSVRDIRRRLVNPPLSPSKYADGFELAGCPGFASWLRERLFEF
ncbi:MAG: PIN domain-containing protein [Caulobacterales bacterium]